MVLFEQLVDRERYGILNEKEVVSSWNQKGSLNEQKAESQTTTITETGHSVVSIHSTRPTTATIVIEQPSIVAVM